MSEPGMDTSGAGAAPAAGDSGTPVNPSPSPVSAGAPSGDTPWYSTLSEEFRSDPNITKFPSLDEFARGHQSAVRMIGMDKYTMPQTEQEWNETYARFGRPESPADYGMPELDYNFTEMGYPEHLYKEDQEAYRSVAHKYGLSDKQFQGVYKDLMDYERSKVDTLFQGVEVQTREAEQALRRDWGESYESRLRIADNALLKFAGKESYEKMIEKGYGRDPDFIKMMHELGSRSMEEMGIDRHGRSTKTPDDLRNELAAIQQSPAYFDKHHPDHANTVKQAQALNERIYG